MQIGHKMTLKQLKPRKALNKAFLKLKPNRNEIEVFKTNLIQLLDRVNEKESEEYHKNLITYFLRKTYYDPAHFINTKGRTDLVIHNGSKENSSVGVIVETKKPTNKSEMLTQENINVKAFQELVLYYLRERITGKNLEIRYLIATNINEWFVFDANVFEQCFAHNKEFVKQFNEFESHRLAGKTTDFFYTEIAKPFIASLNQEIEFTWFDIREYEEPLRNDAPTDDNKLIALFKLLSPEHLLKLPFANDSNTLDKRFYGELLHIIGLSETKEGSKKIIGRSKEGQRNAGSLLENAIIELDSLDKIIRLEKPGQFGGTMPERLFNVALELCITWINRILFLKLLEAQLITYHKGDKSFSFLNLKRIQNYDDLNSLFFKVLARKFEDRDSAIKAAFSKVPYLNSSLFEPTDLEHSTLFISNLSDDKQLPIYSASVLKDGQGKRRTGTLSTIEYLFGFLSAYDFTSEGSEEIQEDNKTLINASVLGLIFEKINGYKDGSFFTPGFITMYMCRETIRRAVVQKFNEVKGWSCETITEIYNKIDSTDEANRIVNSLKICDPAVGSGHFLVSALNEIIAVKNDLKILQDREGKRLKEYHVEVENDELIVSDEDGIIFEYNPKSHESQRIQETLFHEKQTIIENCLFGVDINQNSVKICRLRLWIELLKNAYYKNPTELETLPNIDINIKCGNSLISRFAIDADLGQALKKSKWNIDSYRLAVATYRNAENKEQKRAMKRLIADIKSDFRSEIASNDPKLKRLQKTKGELFTLTNQTTLFEQTKKEKEVWNKKVDKLADGIKKVEAEIEEIKNNKIYENAFEWRFEFPEVLNEEGDFTGFDVVIGNPPYIHARDNFDNSFKNFVSNNYKTVSYQISTVNLFFERSLSLLKSNHYLSFIVPNYWLSTDYDESLRKFLFQDNSTLELINVYQVFDEASVDALLIISQKIRSTSYNLNIASIENTNNRNFQASQLATKTFTYVRAFKIIYDDELPKITFSKSINFKSDFSLDKFFEFRFGIKLYQVGKGNPPQSETVVQEKIYNSEHQKDNSYLPLLRARDVKRYHLNIPTDFYVKYGEHLAEPRNMELFTGKRILVQRIVSSNYLNVCFTASNILCNSDVITLKPKSETDDETILILNGILASKFAMFILKSQNVNLDRATYPKINTKTLQSFPIPSLTNINPKFKSIILEIIGQKEINPDFDTTALDYGIDQLVYQLYDLSEEEIKIVEGGVL